VDTLTESLIQEALERLFSGRTAIVIAHRLTTVQNADLIYVLDKGRIVEVGNHQQLLSHGGIYRELYEKQFIDKEAL
jgi:ABC-type multidrug transport system fused ATPase/permease subunit